MPDWRDPASNPFEPGHDVVPPIWAGRQRELFDWERVVRPRRLIGQYERVRLLLGEPGIGKSVLAAKIAETARASGDVVVPTVRIPRGGDVLALLAQALTQTVHALEIGAAVGDRIATLLARVRSVAQVEIEPAPPPRNPHVHLRDLLIELGRYAAARDKVVLLHLDELQNVRDGDVLSQLLVAVGEAVQAGYEATDAAGTRHRRIVPVAVYVTAPSEFTDLALSLTGSRTDPRSRPVRLGPLEDDDLREALSPFTGPDGWPVPGHGSGVAMTSDAVEAIVARALGDPFLFQLAGKAAWDAEPGEQVVTAGHVAAGWREVRAEARSHVERLVERLPERERELVTTMAHLPPSQRTLTGIARRLGRTPTQLGSASQRLEERGIIVRGKPYRFSARTVEGLLRGEWP